MNFPNYKSIGAILYLSILFPINLAAMQTKKTGFSKWDGLVDLQQAGLPTPNGALVRPHSTKEEIERISTSFAAKCSDDCLIGMRCDGFSGKTPPGICFRKTETSKIMAQLIEWSEYGYAVTLLEGRDRFDGEFWGSILFLNKEGDFAIDFVGPGFDVGDLTKQILIPTITVKNKIHSPIFIYSDPISGEANVESLDRFWLRVDINTRIPTEQEVATRLAYMTKVLLPAWGIEIEGTIEATKKWLVENQCDRILHAKEEKSYVNKADLEYIIFSASLYAHYLLRTNQELAAKAIIVYKFKDQILFIGTYDSHKWGKWDTKEIDKRPAHV